MSAIDRRAFVSTTAATLGALTTPRWLAGRRLAQAGTFVRRNVYCLGEYSREILAYKHAIEVMRGRPATDPTSWQAQANIHGALAAPPGMIADACQHGNLFFLSWHRMYLYYFERIVRQASGDCGFALPYWGYSPTGARALPAPFRSPADATNVLYTEHRSPTVNAGNNLQGSAVDAGSALAQPAFNGFSGFLEGTPHGAVHISVGGWMSAFETAGLDPIFWLHHCNVDRLWEVWLASGGGRANPTGDNNWMTRAFDFYDENGRRITMTGSQIIDTVTQLDYRYAGMSCLLIAVKFTPALIAQLTRLQPALQPQAMATMDSIGSRAPRQAVLVAGQTPEPVRLGGRAREIRLPMTTEAQQTFSILRTTPTAGKDVVLAFDDIRLDSPAAVYYEVYVNLPPATTDTVYTSPHYVGNLTFFGPSPQGHHGGEPLARTLSLLPTFLRLRDLQRWRDDTVRVTLVPRAATEGTTATAVLGQRDKAAVGRVSLRIE
jgi:tyrosinase